MSKLKQLIEAEYCKRLKEAKWINYPDICETVIIDLLKKEHDILVDNGDNDEYVIDDILEMIK